VPNILLLEDDEQLRKLLKTVLTSGGYEVSEAANGVGVCQMHQQQRFDLVITDLSMPDTEGLTVITELRRVDANLRIIAMSGGYAGRGESYLKIALKFGARSTLSKPFSIDEFLQTVRLTLES
jgi:DNA-binding response OmpR family regulator